jgi:hypothetical protein
MNLSLKPWWKTASVGALAIVAVWIAVHALGGGSVSGDAGALVGHWRKTTIVFGSPKDEHLVLDADGSAENWMVRASGRSDATTGSWAADGNTLTLRMEGYNEVSRPFTFYEGQLVFPNIQDQRGFWEKVE